jgi:hypothetical protein
MPQVEYRCAFCQRIKCRRIAGWPLHLPVSVSETGTVRRSVRDMVVPRSESETDAKAVIGAALRECCPYCGAAPRNPHDYAYPHPPETGAKPKEFAPIGEGTICSNCTKTIGYHYQTAEGNLFCEVPSTSDRQAETFAEPWCCQDCGNRNFNQTACDRVRVEVAWSGGITC